MVALNHVELYSLSRESLEQVRSAERVVVAGAALESGVPLGQHPAACQALARLDQDRGLPHAKLAAAVHCAA